jgi:hypothetical protein
MPTPALCAYVDALIKGEMKAVKLQSVDAFLVLYEDRQIQHITFHTNYMPNYLGIPRV